MATATKDIKPSFIDSVKESLVSNEVYVFCNKGTVPLEWPPGCIDEDKGVVTAGGKFMVTERIRYRNIVTTAKGGKSDGFMKLNLASNVAIHGETDRQFLARIEDWIDKNPDEQRIITAGVRIDSGNPFALPFVNWDGPSAMPVDVLSQFVMAQLGDSHEANLDMLKRYAGYELNTAEPRAEVLEILEEIALLAGDESDDDGVADVTG